VVSVVSMVLVLALALVLVLAVLRGLSQLLAALL
jgi:hypothetical protein